VGTSVETERERRSKSFATTRWSVIISSADVDSDDEKAHRALAELCQIYWRPVFAFISARTKSPEDAQDLTQDFFAMILAPKWLRNADQNRGRFRSLLLRSAENFLRDAALRGVRQRRGGGAQMISWDDWMAEAPSQVTVSSRALETSPPAYIFDVRWAVTVVEQALRRLGEECERKGHRRLFETLSRYLTAEREASYASLAGELGLQESDVKRQLHAMRLRYRWLLRSEVARTVRTPSEIDDEIRNLCAALAFGAEPSHTR
jgi:RNA polymerase sigma-70 factor (ECF subfamily)